MLLGQNTLHTTVLLKGQLLKQDLITQSRPAFWAAGMGHGRLLAAALGHRIAPPSVHTQASPHTPAHSQAFYDAIKKFRRSYRSTVPVETFPRPRTYSGAHGPRLFSVRPEQRSRVSLLWVFLGVMRVPRSQPSVLEQPSGAFCMVPFPGWGAGRSLLIPQDPAPGTGFLGAGCRL